MEIKAAIEKNKPFCATLEYIWSCMIHLGDEYGYLTSVSDRMAGAALWVKCGSPEEKELRFLRDMLIDCRDVYEVKQEAA